MPMFNVLQLQTSYQKEYYEKEGGAPQARGVAMQPALKTGGEFSGATTYHNTYKVSQRCA